MKFNLLIKKDVQLALLGVIIALGVHLLDIFVHKLEHGLHVTADDVSYFRPALNWWQYGIWKDGFEGASSYVQRPPLMGIVELIGYWILGNAYPWFVFGVALLVHGYAVSRLFKIIRFYSTEQRAIAGTWLFILLPCFWGFLSYTITEAFEIGLCVIALSYFLIPSQQQIQKMFISLLLMALFRPVLVVLFLPLLFYKLWKDKPRIQLMNVFRREFVTVNILLIALISTTFFWEVRKTMITGEVLNPHPIYHETNETVFRPPHAALTELFKTWETRPEVFHDFVGRTWQQDPIHISRNEVKAYCIERNVPVEPEILYLSLVAYGNLTPDLEGEFCNALEELTNEIKANNRYLYWIKTPLTGIREQVFKSQLNLIIFQETYRGNWFIETLRYLCMAVILLSYLAILIVPFTWKSAEIRLASLGCWVYGFLLFWVQRMNEDRYMLPLVAIGFVLLAVQNVKVSKQT